MNSPKSPTQLAELAMPSRLEGLLSLLIASPMSLLGCTPEILPEDTEGSTSEGPMGSTGSTGVAESTSTGSPITSDDTASTSSTSSTGEPMTSTTDVSTSSSSSTSESSSSSEGGESTTTGGEQGNTCERVGDLMDMCFFGYGYWYEYSCNYYINDAIAEGNVECAQLWNEFYACVADLECAEVNMGIYEACETQWDAATDTCWNFGGTDTFGGEDSGVAFIVPETSGFETGGWASDSGGGGATSGWGTDSGGWGSTG